MPFKMISKSIFKKFISFLPAAFLIAFFFFKIPSFYLVPFYKSSFLTSQALARIIFVLVSIGCLLSVWIARKKTEVEFSSSSKKIIILIIVLFVLQSVSVVVAKSTEDFMMRYKDVFIGYVVFFLFFHFRKYSKQIIMVLIAGCVVNIVYQGMMFFTPGIFKSWVAPMIYTKHAFLVIANMERGRIYTDLYDEAVIPFLLLGLYLKNTKHNFFNTLLIGFIIFFSIVSQFRTRVVMGIFSAIVSLFTLASIPKMLRVMFIIFLGLVFISTTLFTTIFHNKSTLSRFQINNIVKGETTQIRIRQFRDGLNMGFMSPFGVGLGNYYVNIPSSEKHTFPLIKWEEIEQQSASVNIHNIFVQVLAESGFFACLIFTAIISMFIRDDAMAFNRSTRDKKAFIISFWTLFIHGLFNPIIPASYQVFFWGVRGLLLDEKQS